MLELDSLVDGVAAVAYGTPESAAATRAASEGTAGVRGGLGGGGAGAASFAVGEQLQNMALSTVWSLGFGVRGGGAAPAMVRRRGGVRGEAILYVIGKQGPVVRPVRAESRVAL